MKKISRLFLGYSFLFLLHSCSKNEIEIAPQVKTAESQQDFIKRNANVVIDFQEFIEKNQEMILQNQQEISNKYNGNLYSFLTSTKSDDSNFRRILNRVNQNDKLNNLFWSKNKNAINRKIIVDQIYSEIVPRINDLKYLNGDSGDRKTCMRLYMENINDCRFNYLRGTTVAILTAGFGGFIPGIIVALDTGWTFVQCQNIAQRNFDYCLGNDK